MGKTTLWGIVLVLVLLLSCGSTEESNSPDTTEKTIPDKAENDTFDDTLTEDATKQSSTSEEEAADISQVADRRMSLMDFFFNNNKNNNNNGRNEIQTPDIIPSNQQVQVQQQPNQLMMVRESNFPNPNGGLISRLILARRMARLQRISNRLQILPAMLGLLQRQEIPQQQIFNQRVGQQYGGDSYNPADILLDGIGFKNASISPHRQYARFNNPHFAEDLSTEQNQGFGRNVDAPFFGINDVPNQPYPQSQASLDQYGVHSGNFGLRQNVASYDQHQQSRQKQYAYNQQQPLYNQQQFRQQQPGYDQNSQQQQPAFDQQPQVNQQQLYDQQQQLEQQEQLRQQQQQLYDQQQQKLRQQQLYDQQQQQIKQQQEIYEKQQQQLQKPRQEIYNQQEKQQAHDQQQLKLQQDLYEQQKQLKQIILDQQEKLKAQDERFQQLLRDQKQQGQQQTTNQQSRDSSFSYAGDRDSSTSGSSGILDYGGGANLGPGTFEVGLDIGSNSFKSGGGVQNYSPGAHVGGNVGLGAGTLDKTAHEPTAVVHKPVPVAPPALKLPLFSLGLLPKPLLNLNGKVFFGAELGKAGGLTTGGWK